MGSRRTLNKVHLEARRERVTSQIFDMRHENWGHRIRNIRNYVITTHSYRRQDMKKQGGNDFCLNNYHSSNNSHRRRYFPHHTKQSLVSAALSFFLRYTLKSNLISFSFYSVFAKLYIPPCTTITFERTLMRSRNLTWFQFLWSLSSACWLSRGGGEGWGGCVYIYD